LIIWTNIFFMSRGTTSAPAVDRLHSSPRKEVNHERHHLRLPEVELVQGPNSSGGRRSVWHLQSMPGFRGDGRSSRRPRIGERSSPTDLLRARRVACSVEQIASIEIATTHKKIPLGSFGSLGVFFL